jgi:hypothetical protein
MRSFLLVIIVLCATRAYGQEVTAVALAKEWNGNRAAAKAKYAGKTITVTGTIHSVKKCFGADLNERLYFKKNERALLFFAPIVDFADPADLLKLEVGKEITVIGVVRTDTTGRWLFVGQSKIVK